jgi:RES domain-containing protein
MLVAYRVVKIKRKDDAFSGEGARRAGGRWSSKGVQAVYAASTLSLAVLEILMHLEDAVMLDSYGFFAIRFPESIVETIPVAAIPRNWSESPIPVETQRVGDAWIRRNSSAVLAIPSAAFQNIPSGLAETNYLLNPGHKDFGRIRIGAFRGLDLDPRLAK